jgi:hypothetical protein
MAASDYEIAKGTRVGLAKRFRLTATTFVLAKSTRRIRGKTAISQAACFFHLALSLSASLEEGLLSSARLPSSVTRMRSTLIDRPRGAILGCHHRAPLRTRSACMPAERPRATTGISSRIRRRNTGEYLEGSKLFASEATHRPCETLRVQVNAGGVDLRRKR